MVPFADPSDVAGIWRPLTPAETALVEAWIDEASQQVRDDVPDVGGMDVDARIAAGLLGAGTVRSVVTRMVRRIMVNPTGDTSTTEQTGPFSVTRTHGAGGSTGDMVISKNEMRRLMGQRTGQRAYMVTPGPGPVFQGSW